jgi:hypothetical protein
LKGKVSNSRVTSLSFVRSCSTIIAYGPTLDKEMFINGARRRGKISDRSTDTKAVKVYTDLQNNKVSLIRENNKLTGIYMWIHNKSGKKYVGSSLNLGRRLRSYFNKSSLIKSKTMPICRSLLKHGYS